MQTQNKAPARITRRPEWLKKKIGFKDASATSALLSRAGVHTVCKEAKCPNISECFSNKHATFLILGAFCTRNCDFCNVEKQKPERPDPDEPEKIVNAILKLGLRHAVITSVTRDDLPDGGASIFVKTVEALRKKCPKVSIELLIPDFSDNLEALERVAKSQPDIIGHNIEIVPRLYPFRPKSNYARSLHVLRYLKKINKNIRTKSALMLGLGEKRNEVLETLEDLRSVDCDFLALGQYLRPSLKHAAVVEFISPENFEYYKIHGIALGFKHIEAGPYVRSSYAAESYLSK